MQAEILENGKVKLTAENAAEKFILNQIVFDFNNDPIKHHFELDESIKKPSAPSTIKPPKE